MARLISIDFDGTITEFGGFPQIGKAQPLAFEVMKELKENGDILILNTCREDKGYNISKQYLSDAIKFCKENGVEFDGINETPIEHEFRDSELRRKVFAHVYIDDRNLGGFPGWDKVREELL